MKTYYRVERNWGEDYWCSDASVKTIKEARAWIKTRKIHLGKRYRIVKVTEEVVK